MLCLLSHASEDRDVARPHARALNNAGAESWIDEASLTPGPELLGQIMTAVLDQSDVVVFLASQTFLSKVGSRRRSRQPRGRSQPRQAPGCSATPRRRSITSGSPYKKRLFSGRETQTSSPPEPLVGP